MTDHLVSADTFGRPEQGLSMTLPVSLNFLTTFTTVEKSSGILKFICCLSLCPSFTSTDDSKLSVGVNVSVVVSMCSPVIDC